MCFFLRTSFLLRIAGGGAAPSPLHPPTRFYCVTGAPCSRLFFRLLFPSAPPPARVYVLPGAPGYLLLFVLLFPSASRICFPMRFFLRTSFLLRIAGGGAAPSPLHPPTRFYCVTFAPWYLLLFRLLVPSASTIFFSYVLLSSYFLLGIYFATGAPWYLLLFLLLSASASTIWVPMCFFLCTSFLVRIAGGGAALLSFLLVMSIVYLN